MIAAIILIFILGYLAITVEHPLTLDKTVPALLMAAVMWALLAIGFYSGTLNIVDYHQEVFNIAMEGGKEGFKSSLLHHLAKTAEILVFLICAMTIVELIDLHNGFTIVRKFLETRSRTRLLWTIGVICFFLSAVIDNLTATIVLVTILRVLITDAKERMWYVGMAVIAANAGGAWSPMGDVTTTMIWIAERVSALGLVKYLIVPSLVCFAVPFTIASFLPVFKGNREYLTGEQDAEDQTLLSSRKMLFLGLGMIIFVPIFKTITHLPPYMGMIFGLGVVWLVSEYITPERNITHDERRKYSARRALSKIEMPSILFFLGILMAVAALETLVYGTVNGKEVGTLQYLAEVLQNLIPNQDIVIIFLGVCSAIVDNVPLAAAALVMYSEPLDARLWHFIAYSVGTGGSMIIIGSAAGVAAMGMENIPFGWYLKKIGWLAAIGFIAGAITFLFWFPLVASS